MNTEELTEIPKVKIDPNVPFEHILELPYHGNFFIGESVPSPDANVGLQGFPAGEIGVWRFWHPEVHYVLKGRAEITYSLPGFHLEKKTMQVEPYDCYVVPRGADLQFKPESGETLRELYVAIPKEPIYHDMRPEVLRKIKPVFT